MAVHSVIRERPSRASRAPRVGSWSRGSRVKRKEPSLREVAALDKRRRILDAAVAVFARDGFASAKVAAIAKRAGVADGTIYLYFPSKEALLLTLFEELCNEFLDEAKAA